MKVTNHRAIFNTLILLSRNSPSRSKIKTWTHSRSVWWRL